MPCPHCYVEGGIVVIKARRLLSYERGKVTFLGLLLLVRKPTDQPFKTPDVNQHLQLIINLWHTKM